MEAGYPPASSPATSSIELSCLISILKVVLRNDSLDLSHAVTRQSTAKLGLADFSGYDAVPYTLATN